MLYQSTNSPKDKKYGVDANGESPGFANHKILGELPPVSGNVAVNAWEIKT